MKSASIIDSNSRGEHPTIVHPKAVDARVAQREGARTVFRTVRVAKPSLMDTVPPGPGRVPKGPTPTTGRRAPHHDGLCIAFGGLQLPLLQTPLQGPKYDTHPRSTGAQSRWPTGQSQTFAERSCLDCTRSVLGLELNSNPRKPLEQCSTHDTTRRQYTVQVRQFIIGQGKERFGAQHTRRRQVPRSPSPFTSKRSVLSSERAANVRQSDPVLAPWRTDHLQASAGWCQPPTTASNAQQELK